VGIEAAMEQGAEWILVLNEDTILAPDCLTQMVAVGDSDQRIGIVGPMVYHHNEPTIIQSAGGRLNRYWQGSHLAQNEPDRQQFTAPHQVDWISGCAIMLRRQVIEQVGMLDERFFYYWEELEWCVRATRSGWTIMHVPAAKLWHKGVQRDYRPKPYVTYYNTRNRFLLLLKHRAPLSVWTAAWLQTLRTMLSWSIRPKWRAQRSHRDAMWRGTVDFLRHRWGQGQI
jgi:GT2 family glycosyltransferase